MAHSNYAKDRDLMMEAYASVQGEVPKTSTTAMPRGYVLQESSCNSEHEEHSHEDYEVEDGEHLPAEDSSCASHSDEEHGDDTVKVELELDLDKDTASKLHDQLMDQLGLGHPAEDSSCASHSDEEDAEGHHHSGSDDGECDECGGDGCDVCNGTGENEEHTKAEDGE